MVRSSVFSLTAVIISLALASNASAIHEGLQVLYEFDGNTSPALGANTAPSGNAGTNSGVAPAAGFIGSGASDWAADGADAFQGLGMVWIEQSIGGKRLGSTHPIAGNLEEKFGKSVYDNHILARNQRSAYGRRTG